MTRAGPPHRVAEVDSGQALVPGPADEVPGRAALAEIGGGHPLIEAGLGAAGQGGIASGQPVQERHGGLDVAAGNGCLAGGGVPAAEPVAEPAQHVPDRVTVQDLFLAGIEAGGHGGADPAFQLCEVLIAPWQRPGADQHAAQVRQGLTGWQVIEGGVGERALPSGEFGEQRPHLRAAQPAQRDLGPVNAGQGLLEDLQPGADAAGRGVGQQFAELLVQVAAAARTGDQPLAGAAARAGLPLGAWGGAAAA